LAYSFFFFFLLCGHFTAKPLCHAAILSSKIIEYIACEASQRVVHELLFLLLYSTRRTVKGHLQSRKVVLHKNGLS